MATPSCPRWRAFHQPGIIPWRTALAIHIRPCRTGYAVDTARRDASPGADVAGVGPVPAQMWKVNASPGLRPRPDPRVRERDGIGRVLVDVLHALHAAEVHAAHLPYNVHLSSHAHLGGANLQHTAQHQRAPRSNVLCATQQLLACNVQSSTCCIHGAKSPPRLRERPAAHP
jgi:hypothetical protein